MRILYLLLGAVIALSLLPNLDSVFEFVATRSFEIGCNFGTRGLDIERCYEYSRVYGQDF
jgi:hypothetical protein